MPFFNTTKLDNEILESNNHSPQPSNDGQGVVFNKNLKFEDFTNEVLYFLIGMNTKNIKISRDDKNEYKMKTSFDSEYIGVLSLFEKPAINGIIIKRYIKQLQYINDNIKHILGEFFVKRLDKYYKNIVVCQNKPIEEVYTYLSCYFQELEEYNDLLLSIEILSGISVLEEIRNRNDRMKDDYYVKLIGLIEDQILKEVYHWMVSGKITDNLFIIEQKHNELQFHESYYKDKFKLKKEVPFFLKHLSNEIYLSGNFVNFMKLIIFKNTFISFNKKSKTTRSNFCLVNKEKNKKIWDEALYQKKKVGENCDQTGFQRENMMYCNDYIGQKKKIAENCGQTEFQGDGKVFYDDSMDQRKRVRPNFEQTEFKKESQFTEENVNFDGQLVIERREQEITDNIIENISELIYKNSKKEIKDIDDILYLYNSIGITCEKYINVIIYNELNVVYKLYFIMNSSYISDMFDLLEEYIYLPVEDSLFRINSNIPFINNQGYIFEYSEVRMNHLMLKILNIEEFTGNIRKNVIENLTIKPQKNNIINLFLSKKDFLELEIIFRYLFTISSLHKIFTNLPKQRFTLNCIHLLENLRTTAYVVLLEWKELDSNDKNQIIQLTTFVKSCLNKMFLTSNNVFKTISNIIDLLFEYIYEKDNEEKYNIKLMELVNNLYQDLKTVSKDSIFLNFLSKFPARKT